MPGYDEEDGVKPEEFNPDDNRFETDLRYFAGLFRVREKTYRDKYDYFYGPFCKDQMLAQRINYNRIQRVKRNIDRVRMQDLQNQQKQLTLKSPIKVEEDGTSNANKRKSSGRALSRKTTMKNVKSPGKTNESLKSFFYPQTTKKDEKKSVEFDSDSDAQDDNGVVIGNPEDNQKYYMQFYGDEELKPGQAGYVDKRALKYWGLICDGIFGKKDF